MGSACVKMAMPIPPKGDFSWARGMPFEVYTLFKCSYQAITVAAAWETMKEDPPVEGGWLKHPIIYHPLYSLKVGGGSDICNIVTMQAMQFLARNGWNAFYMEYHSYFSKNILPYKV